MTTSKRSPRQKILIPSAQPAQQFDQHISMVSVREICTEPSKFNIDAEYQREYVWSRAMSQRLIDTMLRGLGIGLLEGFKYFDDERAYWEILDGHQRISAILSFYKNEYKTWTAAQKRKFQPNSRFGPVEPGAYFEQLNLTARDRLLEYQLPISKTPPLTPEERAERFLDIQTQSPLTPAEKLHVYRSKANAAATVIKDHPFWDDFYIGEKGRKQEFMSSLYLLALQLSPNGFTELRSSTYVTGLAAGVHDQDITDSVIQAVSDRLDVAACVFAGVQFTDRATIIPMYQAVRFLEEAGCEIHASTHYGRLSSWISNVISESRRASGIVVWHRPLNTLMFSSAQKAFWSVHLKGVMGLFDMQPLDLPTLA